MPSDQLKVKAMGLIFSPFVVTLAQEVSFGMLQYMQCILHGLIFADSEKCQFGAALGLSVLIID